MKLLERLKRLEEFDEESSQRLMHEFAMQNCDEIKRQVFESLNDPSELFHCELAAGQGFYMGLKTQHSQLLPILKATAGLVEALEISARGETQFDGVEAMHAARQALAAFEQAIDEQEGK